MPVDNEGTLHQVDDLEYESLERESSSGQRFRRHFAATIVKRLRVIRRDWKGFILELLLPIAIIVFGLLIMKISFIKDYSSVTLNTALYANDNSPIELRIAAVDATLASDVNTAMTSRYGSTLNAISSNEATVNAFDKDVLFPLKNINKKMRGGLYLKRLTSGGLTLYQVEMLTNTKTQTAQLWMVPLLTAALIKKEAAKVVDITATYSPLPRTYLQLQINNTISGFLGVLIFAVALSFKFASMISFIVKEREDKSKYQQIVSGMNLPGYWLGNFFYDYLLYLVLAVVSVILVSALDVTSLSSGDALRATWILFVLYGLAYTPFTYICGYLFKDYGSAQSSFYFFTFIMSGLLPNIILVLRFIGTSTGDVGRGISWILRFFPSFAFGEGLINITSLALLSSVENSGKTLEIFSASMAGAPIAYIAAGILLYTALVFLIEMASNSQDFMRFWTSEANYTDSEPILDKDVLAEAEKAKIVDPNEYEILTRNLRKVFLIDGPQKNKVAVDNLSFGIAKGEVFGLLGVNGAGKTTTFKMLSGELTSTSGDSYFRGQKISDSQGFVRKNLGYCPQFDALIENLTVREQLELYYDLKSLPETHKSVLITKVIEELNLGEYEDKLSGTLSGGNKRKLSVAMALIGNPGIIFLDEPSTGMDPKARRFMWKIISSIASVRKQSTVILTTHSMEEAEALSTRLGIMVKGNFKCIGTPQHIKSIYGEGFELEVKVSAIKKAEVLQKIESMKLGSKTNIIKSELSEFFLLCGMRTEIQNEISVGGSGGYLYQQLESQKGAEIYQIIEFMMIEEQIVKIKNWMASKFGETEILEHYQTFIRFKTKPNVSIGRIFSEFENAKATLSVQEYSVKQATVEQIFNKFAAGYEKSEYGG